MKPWTDSHKRQGRDGDVPMPEDNWSDVGFLGGILLLLAIGLLLERIWFGLVWLVRLPRRAIQSLTAPRKS